MKKEYLIKGVKLLIPQKIWLKMKLITVFLFLVTFCLQANNTYSQNATVNLNLENVSLTDVFREIEKQSDYRFFFNSAVLSAVKKQNIKTGEKSITSVLDQLFSLFQNILIVHCLFKFLFTFFHVGFQFFQ